MSSLVGVVVTHGKLAAGLVECAERITGMPGALIPVSNEGCDPKHLGERILEATKGGPALVFVDMPVGSCLQAAARSVRDEGEQALVAGVNLPMLVDFCFHRDVSPSAAAERAVAQGLASIKPLGL
jgi:mannose/fructose-specific phosphotransferase system component IIA